jgi:hypothetical protein
MNELFKNILNVISKANHNEIIDDQLLLLKFNDSQNCLDSRNLLKEIELTEIQKNSFCIYLWQTSFCIFYDVEDYRRRFTKNYYEADNLKVDILILKGDDSKSMIYLKQTSETLIDSKKDSSNFLFINTIAFFKLIFFLKDNEHKEDKHFYFVDYFNIDYRRIIITSLKKEGKLTIGYPMMLPDFDNRISIKSQIDRFILAFQEKQLPKFIKTELFNYLPAYRQEERLEAFIKNLNVIMEKAEQNFEIYLSDLSLDNFKTQFLEFRIKYFNQFRDILSKITTQILAFPLSITASAFATYKTIDSILLCSLIVAAFIVFSIYSLFTLRAHKEDVIEIKKLFEADFKSFSSNPFFIKYPDELKSFQDTNSYIIKRSKFLIRCIDIYSGVLISTNFLFILFVVTQALFAKVSIAIIVIVALLLFALSIYYSILK